MRLGMRSDELDALILAENEAAVALAIRGVTFRPSSRWLATVTGLPVDAVNVALQGLLRRGVLTMAAPNTWTINRSASE